MAPKKAEKRKAEAPAAEVPSKEAKKEEPAKEKEPAKESEQDAAAETRPALKPTVAFDASGLTLNVVPTAGDKLLMPLNQGGMQFLVAGARANVGVKTGRYAFELKIAEKMTPPNLPQGARVGGPAPRQVARVGVSVAEAGLVLGADQSGSVFFDADGMFVADGTKKSLPGARFVQDQVIAVVLNLDKGSANNNTISLFRDGVRVTEPQPLPDTLVGKTLYPHVSFRSLSVQVNFGPALLKALPFSCRCLQAAAAADVEHKKADTGKKTVHFPVGIPDEGIMDWTANFLAKNPTVTELSDRMILEWCKQSGICKTHNARPQVEKHSNDRPEFNFAVPALDDLSVRKVIANMSGIVPRDYLVLEVKGNLTPEDRKETLSRFSTKNFKRIAHVAMGKPDATFIAAQHESMLKAKQSKVEQQWKAEKIARDKKKQVELRVKQIKERNALNEEKRKKAKAEAEKKEGGADDSASKEEAKEDPKPEAPAPAEETKEDEEMPPKAELTEEEKAKYFSPGPYHDVTPSVLARSFSHFSLPSAEEGFDQVKFAWDKESGCKSHLKEYLQKLRLTCRVEDLKPGKEFSDKHAEWLKTMKEWQAKQKSTKDEKAGTKKKAEGEEEAGNDGIDVASVEDVCDVGDGKPLFQSFGTEDWVLFHLRLEMHLMVHAFSKDADGRKIPEQHFDFCYSRYFQKQLVPKQFGVDSRDALLKMVQDTVKITDQMLEGEQPEDIELSTLLKLTENGRRQRQRRIDAGDETARLKFSPQCMQTRGGRR